jgi:hypothetical protein
MQRANANFLQIPRPSVLQFFELSFVFGLPILSTTTQNRVPDMVPMLFVIPAKAGIQASSRSLRTPAFAGVTGEGF